MVHLVGLMTGLLMIVESRESDIADRTKFQGFLPKRVSFESDAAQAALNDYDKFITPNLEHLKQGNGFDALSPVQTAAHTQDSMAFTSAKGQPMLMMSAKDFKPPKIADKDEERAAQKLLYNGNDNHTSWFAIGVSSLALL